MDDALLHKEQHGAGPAVAPASEAAMNLSARILTAQQATARWQRMEARFKDVNATYTKFTGLDGRQRIPDLTLV